MAATVTLSSTTLAENVSDSAGQIKVASTAGMIPGYRLYLDGELMSVISLAVDPWVNVLRGRDGTHSAPHQSSSVIYIGRGDRFYEQDPTGRPPAAVPVVPYINVVNGTVWLPQGDESPSATANRWWQKQATSYDIGALGVRTTTTSPTVSS